MSNTVLIAEDDNRSSALLADVLMTHGYITLRTSQGRDVVGIARRHSPGLIVVDVRLPDLAGTEVLKLLKADPQLRDIPVIAVTPCSMRGDKEVIIAAGFDGYVCKPISVGRFLQVIDQALPVADGRRAAG